MTNSEMVESYAASWVLPFLRDCWGHGTEVIPVPREIVTQQRYGDYWLRKGDKAINVELKSEQRWTGNLFLEVWSNERKGIPGWLYHHADSTRLAYAFNDKRRLYCCTMGAVRAWAHGKGATQRTRIEEMPVREQGQYSQNNCTVGRLVPVDVFLREVRNAQYYEVKANVMEETAQVQGKTSQNSRRVLPQSQGVQAVGTAQAAGDGW